jgi:CheY-like chemotaxis protein/HAMP domain-containing protein
MVRFNDLRIGQRLLIGFSVLLLFCMGLAIFTILELYHLSGITSSLYNSPFEVRRAIRDLQIEILQMEIVVDEVLLDPTSPSGRIRAADISSLDERADQEFAVLFDRFLGDRQTLFDGRAKFSEWRSARDAVIKAALAGDIGKTRTLIEGNYSKILDFLDSEIEYVKAFSSDKAKSFYESALKARDGSVILSLVIIALMVVAGIGLSIAIALSITGPIRRMLFAVRAIAEGDLEARIDEAGKDEIALLSLGLREMQASLRGYVALAGRVAEGNYDGTVEARSDRDLLAKALASMLGALRGYERRQTHDAWVRDGINGLNEATRGDGSTGDFARRALAFLAKYTGGAVGSFYSEPDEAGALKRLAGWAFTPSPGRADLVRSGEGLAGQALLVGELFCADDIPADYLAVDSTLGSGAPRFLAILPILTEGEGGRSAVGLLELGFLARPSDKVLEFLRSCTATLRAGLVSALAREGIQRLLDETCRQSALLQRQQEELRVTNEELEQQTGALQRSEEELQQQQEELRVYNETLQEQALDLEAQRDAVSLKNAELENTRLALQLKAQDFEKASRYKSEFLANMSHELRTPLNSILILSQLIAEDRRVDEGKLHEYARTINVAGSDLLRLITDSLDLAKIEAGRIELHPESHKTADIAKDIRILFGAIAEKKGLRFEVEVLEGCPESIRTDGSRLQQIIKNLVSNSFKFTEKGFVRVELDGGSAASRGYRDDAGSAVSGPASGAGRADFCIRVKDSGIGIARENQDHVFEPFVQADGATSRKYGGTGLGLSISRELAGILGGSLRLDSEPGRGSTFEIRLPRELPKPAPLQASKQPTGPSTRPEAPVPGAGATVRSSTAPSSAPPSAAPPSATADAAVAASEPYIPDDRDATGDGRPVLLVIEDDPDFASILRDRARERGFKCVAAGDGEGGLALARELGPRAIILDIGLPGMDGWEVLDQLKKDERTRHIPVHFMSGRAETMHALERGAIGFLRKPATLESLNSLFDKIAAVSASRPRRVLVVEDDHVQRSAIAELIADSDVSIDAVGTGAEAIELLEAGRYDCVILDLGLRDMSGMELAARVRDKSGVATPIIVYTGRDIDAKEEIELRRLSESVIIKGARSPERLVDEVTLFLHKVESEMPPRTRRLLDLSRSSGLEGRKVLLVDDDMRNLFALTSVLEEEGIRVVQGRDGREALALLAANPDTSLILMDVMMPEMDGLEAIARIRSDGAHRMLPIIALTAKVMKGDRGKCIEAGATDYLSKPVDINRLVSLLRIWIR